MEEKKQYIIKKGMKEYIKKQINFKDLANKVGITSNYMSQIVNGKRKNISKTVIYAICKAISPDLEIQDLFDIK